MRILGHQLTESEVEIFVAGSRDVDHPRLRWVLALIDMFITLVVIVMLGIWHDNDMVTMSVTFCYIGMAVLSVWALVMRVNKLNGGVSNAGCMDIINLGNSALDWPFGRVSLPYTIKNVVVGVAMGYMALGIGSPVMLTAVIVSFIATMLGNYALGIYTLQILRSK